MIHKTILLIEDDPETQLLFTQLLESYGYHVFATSDGVEALEYVRSHGVPSLILMDLTFPRITPEEFVHQLRSEAKATDVPLILVSGKPDIQDYVDKFDAVGALRKPFDIDRAMSTIGAVLSSQTP